MNRLYLATGALLVIVALSVTSCNLYKRNVATSVNADITQKALQGAQAASVENLKSDVQVQETKGAVLDSVRPKYATVRETYAQTKPPKGLGVVDAVDAVDPWVSVFNDAVRSSNKAIESSGSVLGEM